MEVGVGGMSQNFGPILKLSGSVFFWVSNCMKKHVHKFFLKNFNFCRFARLKTNSQILCPKILIITFFSHSTSHCSTPYPPLTTKFVSHDQVCSYTLNFGPISLFCPMQRFIITFFLHSTSYCFPHPLPHLQCWDWTTCYNACSGTGLCFNNGTPWLGGVVKFISTSILTVFGIWYLMMKKHFFKSIAALVHLPRAITLGP